MLNIYKILKNTKVEGPKNRFCLWVQGCKKHCKGCWAKETWEFNIGQNYTVEDIFDLIKVEKDIDGVTFLGGEPFEQAKDLSELAKKVRKKGLSVVCFTGYTIEELQTKNDPDITALLNNIDLLIDGGFEIENFDLSRPWVGSSNQRYIFLTDKFSMKDITAYRNKIEARISPMGELEINGMGDFERIKKSLCLQLGKNNVE